MGNPVNWEAILHTKMKKYGNGSNISGPHGKKVRPAALHGNTQGAHHKTARRRPIWILHAHQGNSFIHLGFIPDQETQS